MTGYENSPDYGGGDFTWLDYLEIAGILALIGAGGWPLVYIHSL
jgi:hypothetical protein